MPDAQFILFQGRILNTTHMVSLVPPRPDGGKYIIEARMVGNVSFVEEYEDDEVAAGRYLDLASGLLGEPRIATGVRRDDSITTAEPTTAPVGDPGIDELLGKIRQDLSDIDVR